MPIWSVSCAELREDVVEGFVASSDVTAVRLDQTDPSEARERAVCEGEGGIEPLFLVSISPVGCGCRLRRDYSKLVEGLRSHGSRP